MFQLLPCFILLSCMSCLLILCSLTFTPPYKADTASVASIDTSTSLVERLIYVNNWRNSKFVIWAIVVPSALFGYFVPFVHLVQYAKNLPLDEDEDNNVSKASFLLACIAISSGEVRSGDKLHQRTYQELAASSLGSCLTWNSSPEMGTEFTSSR